ncbi:MAG TPA: D-alanine--D-alanine ligase family protein [Solirubrobacteraceae bacterium]|nr:D-alanine--D-alanine ligase family protein [Solirubrobacteraceae bacterium]
MSATQHTAPELAARALTVVVLAGGRSSEHDVSLASARAISEGLADAGHEVRRIEIARDGAWRCEGERLSVCPGAGLLGADVVFPALHGPFGEDGTVQGLLEALDVAYVGAGVAASALCMDKVLFKQLMGAAGVPQVDYRGVREERFVLDPEGTLAELARLGLPVFVKPAHLGSSMGIVKVNDARDMAAALGQAFAHDPLAIVEAAAPGAEVECAVLGLSRPEHELPKLGVASSRLEPGSRPAAGPAIPALASEPGEIRVPGEWYDFQAKYAADGMELLVPARISAAARARVQELALETFAHAGCEGLARVDFFVAGERVLVNELNTMPGFTPTSVYAKLMASSGVPYPELVDRLCRLALERHARRQTHSY